MAQRDEPFKAKGRVGWQIRWRDPITGERPQRGGFKTKEAARAYRDRELGYAESNITLTELRDRYLAVHGGAESTKRELRRRLDKAVETFGEVNPARLTGEEIEAWRQTISEGQRFEVTQALKQALKWGAERALLARNPAATVKNSAARPREQRPFVSWEEIEAVAEELGPWGPIPIFGAGTGLRPGEWLALERRDLDLHATTPTVHVQRRLTKDGKLAPPKNGKARRVPLRPRVVEALVAMPARLGTRLQFPAQRGGYINLHNWRGREWSAALEAAGFVTEEGKADRGPYSLRHTFATWAIAEGLNTFQLARLMGTSVEMIDTHYGHLLDDADEAAMRAFEQFDSRPTGRVVDALEVEG